MTPYPETFYIVHRRYNGPSFPAGGTWGNIEHECDGPQADDEAVIEALIKNWDEPHEPDATDYRVWHITPDKPREDCTKWALQTMIETMRIRMGYEE